MRGAGGTSGGLGQFFIGLFMLCGGFYLLLNNITVRSHWGFGTRLYNVSGFGGSGVGITTGMILIPFIFGVGMIFYNARNWAGWVLAAGSLGAMIFGVIASLQFTIKTMSAFELIMILVLAVGGLGLFLRSLKNAG